MTQQYKIHPIVMGTKVFDKSFMTYQQGMGEKYTIPIYCWYLEGGDKKILVDTGERDPIISDSREKDIGGKIYTFEEGLAKWGLKPGDIDIIIHTHLHRDHCENDFKCVNAKIYVHELELETIFDPHAMDFRYVEETMYDVEDRNQLNKITEDTEVLPGITMVHTPAHTPGGMSIRVETSKGTAVIAGFCTILENFYPPAAVKAWEMEVTPPGTLINVRDAYRIVLEVKNSADIILPPHEPKFASMPTIPEE